MVPDSEELKISILQPQETEFVREPESTWKQIPTQSLWKECVPANTLILRLVIPVGLLPTESQDNAWVAF